MRIFRIFLVTINEAICLIFKCSEPIRVFCHKFKSHPNPYVVNYWVSTEKSKLIKLKGAKEQRGVLEKLL